MSAHGIELFTFDCYGTLVDWESGILAALAECLPKGDDRPDDDRLLAAYAKLEGQFEADTPDRAYPEILEDVARGLGEQFGFDVKDADAERFAGSVGDWKPFEDTVESMRRLRASGARLAILSNVDRASFGRTAERLGCELDAVWVAEDIGSYKPDRRNFEALLAGAESLGIASEAVLHCAESVRHDIDPAHEIGLSTAWVDRRMGRGGGASGGRLPKAAPRYRVSGLGELCDQLGL